MYEFESPTQILGIDLYDKLKLLFLPNDDPYYSLNKVLVE